MSFDFQATSAAKENISSPSGPTGSAGNNPSQVL